jgi:hypothetical protein
MESMTMETYLWTTLGAFLSLCIFSFLYKDNPFYKFAEHLVAGLAAGYFVIILWHNGLKPNLFDYVGDGNFYLLWLDSSHPWYMVPAFLGALMWTRFSRKWSWVSRWPMAIYIGIGVGLSIPLGMRNAVNMQLFSTMRPMAWDNFLGNGYLDPTSGFSHLLIFVGMLAALFYFFFSKEHKGVFNGVAKFGIGILMIGFGATFGFTVMARISLFIQRIQKLGEWSSISWTDGAFTAIWLIVCGSFIAVGIYEFIKYMRNRGQTKAAA